MPEMDGFALVERIKRTPNLTNAFILMLTSGEHIGDLARCRELGVSAYLTKPIRRAELRVAIAAAITSVRNRIEDPVIATAQRIKKGHSSLTAHILLAEDNLVNQRVARAILEKGGHTVVVTNNGRRALALLEEETFDLVLMDVQMPEMDGFEATAAIREKEKTSGVHVPIIAMTAHAITGDRERCLSAGMDDYISKPIHGAALLDLIGPYCKIPASA